jgi:hypothetical protein
MPAVSKAQQRFMGMVYKHKTDGGPAPSKAVAKAAKSMTTTQAHDFAKTKHKGLPKKVSETLFKSPALNEESGRFENLYCSSDQCHGTQRHEKQPDGSMRCLTCGRIKYPKQTPKQTQKPVPVGSESVFKSGIKINTSGFIKFIDQALVNV